MFMGIERRVCKRFPVILVAEVTELPAGIPRSGRTSDISETGCFVDSLPPLPTASQIRLRLTRGHESFEAPATVVYSPKLGMGIRFEEPIPPKQLAVLHKWIDAFKEQVA
jgi:hypothetical protein